MPDDGGKLVGALRLLDDGARQHDFVARHRKRVDQRLAVAPLQIEHDDVGSRNGALRHQPLGQGAQRRVAVDVTAAAGRRHGADDRFAEDHAGSLRHRTRDAFSRRQIQRPDRGSNRQRRRACRQARPRRAPAFIPDLNLWRKPDQPRQQQRIIDEERCIAGPVRGQHGIERTVADRFGRAQIGIAPHNRRRAGGMYFEPVTAKHDPGGEPRSSRAVTIPG